MQHIGLQLENEKGEVEESFGLEGIDMRIVERAPAVSPFLRSIDPYGNTVFNQLQIPRLILELQALAAQTVESDLRENVERVAAFLEASIDIHTCVRFTGD